MISYRFVVVSLSVVLAGCSEGESSSPGASNHKADANAAETSSDAADEDVSVDAALDGPYETSWPDTSQPDVTSPDADEDSAAPDATPDGSESDVALPTVGAWPESAYDSLSSDVAAASDMPLLVSTVTLPAQSWVLVSSDGRYGPGGGTAANVFITVDGVKVTNSSYIDWGQSTNPQQHCFNAVGALNLDAGVHEVRLEADVIDGGFYVGAGSNLAVMIHPADSVDVQALNQDSSTFAYTTAGIEDGDLLPHDAILSHSWDMAAAGDVIALGSGRSFHSGSGSGTYGDAMWGIHMDGSYVGNGAGLWTVNDIWTGAETQAPMFLHAFVPSVNAGVHVLSLDASEFPWGSNEDSVQYRVGAGTRLVAMTGGMHVRGSAPISQAQYDTTDYIGIGTDQSWPGVPEVGTDVELATATFDVPDGHSGVVMFLAKSRVQGDSSDQGGSVSLRLKLDGTFVGSTGIQQLASPDSVSQRTIATSYLAAGTAALAPGQHTIQAIARADGSFIHLAMVKDLPLLWFD